MQKCMAGEKGWKEAGREWKDVLSKCASEWKGMK
jgi:hypothetical protein